MGWVAQTDESECTCGVALRGADGSARILRTKEVGVPIQPGDVLHLQSAGGGGWGDRARRLPEAAARDIEEGYTA